MQEQNKTALEVLQEKIRSTPSRKEYMRDYMRKYRKENPEHEKQQRITCAKLLLEREGYTVIAPESAEKY